MVALKVKKCDSFPWISFNWPKKENKKVYNFLFFKITCRQDFIIIIIIYFLKIFFYSYLSFLILGTYNTINIILFNFFFFLHVSNMFWSLSHFQAIWKQL